MDLLSVIDKIESFWQKLKTLNNDKFNKEVPENIIYIFEKAKTAANFGEAPGLEESLVLCEATIEATWEQLNIGHWSSVPDGPRILYAQASLLKCLLLLRKLGTNPDDVEHQAARVQAALSACDLGLLLGAPLPGNILQETAQMLNSLASSLACKDETELDIMDVQVPTEILNDESLPSAQPIPVMKCPSLETFYVKHFVPKTPVVLTECVEHWPARKKWSAKYLAQVAGGRTVPVELGVHYADDNWGQQLMTVKQFVADHLQQSETSTRTSNEEKAPLGYLAQHQLFDQVPELRNDIYEPEYCCLREETKEEEEEESPEINAWFGPAGTLSPLHFDPKHNILVQVKGYKRIWLFSPSDSAYLYPHESAMLLSNTARVDPEKPDPSQFPLYSNAKAMCCILRPGDALYIPPKWWHHVRALALSMSVSFWWM